MSSVICSGMLQLRSVICSGGLNMIVIQLQAYSRGISSFVGGNHLKPRVNGISTNTSIGPSCT